MVYGDEVGRVVGPAFGREGTWLAGCHGWVNPQETYLALVEVVDGALDLEVACSHQADAGGVRLVVRIGPVEEGYRALVQG